VDRGGPYDTGRAVGIERVELGRRAGVVPAGEVKDHIRTLEQGCQTPGVIDTDVRIADR